MKHEPPGTRAPPDETLESPKKLQPPALFNVVIPSDQRKPRNLQLLFNPIATDEGGRAIQEVGFPSWQVTVPPANSVFPGAAPALRYPAAGAPPTSLINLTSLSNPCSRAVLFPGTVSVGS